MTRHALPNSFIGAGEVKGFNFRRVAMNPKVAIFEVYNDETQHFEVFLREYTPVCENFAERRYSETEFREVYPKAQYFGQRAWTKRSFPEAMKKYEQLTNEN